MGGILDVIAQALKPSSDPMPAMRSHPGDAADLSALQLVPHIPKSLINDIAKYGTQAVTGEVSDSDLLYQPELTGNAKALSDRFGDAVGGAINYKNRGLLMPDGGLSVGDMIGGAVNAYQGIKPGLIDRIGEANVNRAEGGGLLGAMLIPGQVSKVAPIDKFYSQAVRASGDLQRKQGNAQGFFNDLTGKGQVKPDELNAMGFQEHFGNRSDISREEVQSFISDNQLKLQETRLGRDDEYGLFDADDGQLEEMFATREEAEAALALVDQDEFYLANYGSGKDTSQFGDYTLGGGDNYRELLLQTNNSKGLLDEIEALDATRWDIESGYRNSIFSRDGVEADNAVRKRFDAAPNDIKLEDFIASDSPYYASLLSDRDALQKTVNEGFSSGHFKETNILAHLRMKDRVDTDGNKTLLIEEAQSDWHQKGADVGYKPKDGRGSKPLQDEMDRIEQEMGRVYEASRVSDDPEVWMPLNEQFDNLNSELSNLKYKADEGVPDAPFKTDDKSSWYNLAMKRGLLEAVEGGYDKMAITTGKQQAERYDLSNSIGSVKLLEESVPNNRASGGDPLGSRTVYLLDAYDLDGNKVINRRMDNPEKELPDVVGKEVARKLLDQEAGPVYPDVPSSTANVKILNGLDLSVGGEGMKQFYDRTLPNTLNKLVKQDGVKVGKSELPRDSFEQDNALLGELGLGKARASDTVHSIDITPEMRERVKKGLPLFATAGAALGLTEMMSQQQQQQPGTGLFNGLQY